MDTNRRLTLSVTEAAQVLGISRALAYELVAQGELPSLQFGRRLVVPSRAIERLLASCEATETTESETGERSEPLTGPDDRAAAIDHYAPQPRDRRRSR
jgi:excisionase family DNA binding protein